ncbi:amidohydrolase family protein [Thalassobaculum sp.]|uniref:amidohydrolase family protein n=1 Tax=Thalassobaculum sp. TaxID=2022740 RepID=UPI0032EFD998
MRAIVAGVVILMSGPTLAEPMPLFDAHIHYSHDAVLQVPPAEAVAILRSAGVARALVSSSDDDGTQKLVEAAPDIVVPSLRPYRRRGEISTWMHDPSVIDYVEARLARFKYRALGEFHAYGDDIETPVLQRMIALAKEHDLLLHAHSDADAVERIFRSYPGARVLWAHSGFDHPDQVRALLRRHANLWSDLAFRSEHGSSGRVPPEWRAAFEEFPDRFMIGTDTFAPERWYYIGSHAEFSRAWLSDLPAEIAEQIAYRNAEKMLKLLD